jgi:anti-sigma B factor antagonist
MMSNNGKSIHQVRLENSGGPFMQPRSSRETDCALADGDHRPRFRLQVVERIVIIRFPSTELLVGEDAARDALDLLGRIVKDKEETRFLVNFSGVKWLSSEMLGALVGFHQKVNSRGGTVLLCGLEPLMREVFRVSNLDRAFEICTHEPEALGLLVH